MCAYIELVHTLYYQYAVNNVYGIRGGFHGFQSVHSVIDALSEGSRDRNAHAHRKSSSVFTNADNGSILLTPEAVDNIHHQGGMRRDDEVCVFDGSFIIILYMVV